MPRAYSTIFLSTMMYMYTMGSVMDSYSINRGRLLGGEAPPSQTPDTTLNTVEGNNAQAPAVNDALPYSLLVNAFAIVIIVVFFIGVIALLLSTVMRTRRPYVTHHKGNVTYPIALSPTNTKALELTSELKLEEIDLNV